MLPHLLTAALLAFTAAAQAAPILTPSTTTYGGKISGGNFVTGAATSGFSWNGWPTAQAPG